MDAPSPHSRFLSNVLPRIRQDVRVTGVAIAGSIAGGHPDIYSDVDLIVVIDDEAFDAVMKERLTLIDTWAALVAGFTGEHVGEPRLIITLVGPPLLHVDFKFVRTSDFAERVENPDILWDRDGRLANTLAEHPLTPPSLDLQWIEDRVWIWVHYGATKLGRGELFETIGFLNYLRETVLGPLAARRVGAAPEACATSKPSHRMRRATSRQPCAATTATTPVGRSSPPSSSTAGGSTTPKRGSNATAAPKSSQCSTSTTLLIRRADRAASARTVRRSMTSHPSGTGW